MYENRFIAFIDILGFGDLVQSSAKDKNIQEKIFEALNSIQSDKLNEGLYARVNEELIPPEELEAVKEIARVIAKAGKAANPVTITYFSDSLVISALENDVIASQLVIDLVIKLKIKMWTDHGLLIRGGITLGKLTHIEGGPLYGPAMNRAYYLESKEAKYPRVLIDEPCLSKYREVETFGLFESSISKDESYSYISLATSLYHTLTDSSLVLSGETVLRQFRNTYEMAPDKIGEIANSCTDEKIKSKYQWLLNEFNKIGKQ